MDDKTDKTILAWVLGIVSVGFILMSVLYGISKDKLDKLERKAEIEEAIRRVIHAD